jgi:hypothetical protein
MYKGLYLIYNFKNQFDTVDECKQTCPGKCNGLECNVPNTVRSW